MSDDKKQYWDEIEQQLNKVTEERQREKSSFAEKKQRKAHRNARKKGKRSSQYADDQVLAAIAAVEALTGNGKKQAEEADPWLEKEKEYVLEQLREDTAAAKNTGAASTNSKPDKRTETFPKAEPKGKAEKGSKQDKAQTLAAIERELEEKAAPTTALEEKERALIEKFRSAVQSKKKTDLAEAAAKPEEIKAEQQDSNADMQTAAVQTEENDAKEEAAPMITLGPVFPLEQFDRLAAEKEAADSLKPRDTISLGPEIPVDESLLIPIEERIKAKAGPKLKKPDMQEPDPKEEPEVLGVSEESEEPEVLPEKPQENIAAAAADTHASMQLDRMIDAAVDLIRATGGGLYRVIRLDHSSKDGREFGPQSFEKEMAQRRVRCKEQYEIVRDRAAILQARFSEREQGVAVHAASCIDRIDCGVARCAAKTEYLCLQAHRKHRQVEDWARANSRLLLKAFSGAVAAAAVAALIVGQMSAYEYMYNGKVLGVVKNQDDVYKTIDIIGSKMGDAYGTKIEIDKESDISFRRVVGMNQQADSIDDILNSLSYMRDVKAKAYGIIVNGKQQVIVQNKKIANDILDGLKAMYMQGDSSVTYDKAEFMEKVKLKEIDTKLGNIQNQEEATTFLLTGSVEKTIHTVEQGQTFSGIANSYGLRQSELMAMNPGITPDKLKIGQEIYLNQDRPVLNVRTEETVSYGAPLNYEIVYEDTSTLYKGEQTVKSKGSNGQQAIVAKVVRENGAEISRDIISSQVISQPVSQVVLVGTKEKPKLVAGNYQYPVRGARLSSKFGSRWGSTHKGIDLACASGTKITAADGGTVTFSGYKGSYGNLVIISHGNGRETYYAHCSKLVVSKGQKVYQGQHIANVGSTGRSTGPHVHFEVHINGVAKNPLNYL